MPNKVKLYSIIKYALIIVLAMSFLLHIVLDFSNPNSVGDEGFFYPEIARFQTQGLWNSFANGISHLFVICASALSILVGSTLLDAGAYVIHAAKNFFGREPVCEHRVLHHDQNGLDMHGSILMDFGNNQTAQLSFGMNNSYKNSYSVWGTKGEITLLRAFSIPEHHIPICRIVNQGLVREYQLQPCNHFVEELKAFASRII